MFYEYEDYEDLEGTHVWIVSIDLKGVIGVIKSPKFSPEDLEALSEVNYMFDEAYELPAGVYEYTVESEKSWDKGKSEYVLTSEIVFYRRIKVF